MSQPDQALLVRGSERFTMRDVPSQSPRRINVAVSADMLAAISLVVEREQVTLTEAVRRLITYGDFVYRAVKEDHAVLRLRVPQGSEREVLLI